MRNEAKFMPLALALGALAFTFSTTSSAQPVNTTCGGSAITANADVWECLEVSDGAGNYTDETDQGAVGPFPFNGPASLTHPLTGSLSCTLSVEGMVEMDTSGDVVYIDVTSANSSGPGTCSNVTFGGLPWSAQDAVFGTPGILGTGSGDVHTPDAGIATGVINGVTIFYTGLGFPIQICNGSVDVEFGNSIGNNPKSDPSYFTFEGVIPGSLGDCEVDGTVTAKIDVNAF